MMWVYLFISAALFAAPVERLMPDGNLKYFLVEDEEILDAYLEASEEERESIFGDFVVELSPLVHSGNNSQAGSVQRNYWAPITDQERSYVGEIVLTLADTSTPKLIFEKKRLDEIGDKVNHLHPLNFLLIIFGDDKLKVKVKNIKGKSMVWREFSAGVKNSMTEEARKGNLLPEQVSDFALKLSIKEDLLQPLIKKARYEEVITTLLDNIKRNDDHDRYNL